MPRRVALWGFALVLVAACSSGPGSPTPSTVTPGAESPAAGGPVATGNQLFPVPGGFDIDRVRLMEPAELPIGVPVPVPFGGEIDATVGVFEGEVLAVDYDPRFFATAAAFYATWIEQQGLSASPLIPVSATAAGWEVTVGGEPVRIEVTVSPAGDATQLRVYWD